MRAVGILTLLLCGFAALVAAWTKEGTSAVVLSMCNCRAARLFAPPSSLSLGRRLRALEAHMSRQL